MASAKFNLLIEAVRYGPNGSINLVRVYERRGPAFSDLFLLPRQALLERMNNGATVVTGRRKEYLGGMFEVEKDVKLTGEFISTQPHARRDTLDGVPVF
jgi:hypothetical protein